MRTNSVPAEFGFRAIYNQNGTWELTSHYFLTEDEATKFFTDIVPKPFIWPVEVMENGAICIPDREEWCE